MKVAELGTGSALGRGTKCVSHPRNTEAETLEVRVGRERLELKGKLSHSLAIVSPEGASQELSARIGEYDARYEVFYKLWNGLDKLYGKLPVLREQGAPAEKIVAAAMKALQSHYDALKQFVDLLRAGEPLLRESADALEKLKLKRQHEAEREWREVCELLKHAGFAPEDHVQFDNGPDVIRHQFRAMVDRSSRVRKRRGFVESIQSRINTLRAWADATPHDIECVEAARNVVFARLTGPACRW